MVNFVVFGCGKICARFIKGLALCENGKLIGFGSTNIERAKQYAENYQVDLYGSYDQLLENPEVDAVYISTYNPGHYDLIERCLKKGKHVMCEKPMVPTKQQYNALFSLARENHVVLMEAIKGVFLPMNQQIRQLIKEKELGEVKYIHASYCYRGPFPKDHWVFDPITGGCLQDVGSYPASVVNHILDYPQFDSIRKTITFQEKTPVFAQVICKKDDLQVQLNSSLVCNTENYLEVYGTKGMIKAKNFWKGGLFDLIYFDGRVEKVECEMLSDFYYETKHFIDTILSGQLESDVLSEENTLIIAKCTDLNDY